MANDAENERRREFVKQMTKENWNVYVQNAWGHAYVEPVTRKPITNYLGWNSGHTIFASITTLWVMDLRDAFDRCKHWIESEFDFSTVNTEVHVPTTEQYYISSLLSCYALTRDEMFLNKAWDIAEDMVPAYQTETGLPNSYVNLRKCVSIPTSITSLSQIGLQTLEYNYLSDLTNDGRFKNQVIQMFDYMKNIYKPEGLYYDHLINGQWPEIGGTHYYNLLTFFDSLLKTFIQSNGENNQAIEMFNEAIIAMDRNELFVNNPMSGRIFALEYCSKTKTKSDYMGIQSSRLGAILTLAANALENSLENADDNLQNRKARRQIDRYKNLAKKIIESFYIIAARTRTGLPAFYLKFGVSEDNLDNLIACGTYHLSPELAESYFIMWRLTHEQKYRDYAWQMTQAIHRHCRTEYGSYSDVENVNEVPTKKRNNQRYDFMSGTLKYLYLTFCEDTVLPLDQWVFSAIGNPLPIKGKNDAYEVIQ